MTKFTNLFVTSLIFVFAFLLTSYHLNKKELGNTSNKKFEIKTPKIPQKDRPDEADYFEYLKTRDPRTNQIPKERLLAALEYMNQLKESGSRVSIGGITWTERGPNNVGGRTRAILVDLNDPTRETIFAGGVAGGLWKTTNISNPEPNWVQINDFFDNLAISSIDQNPNNPDEIYFGTGEGWHNFDAIRGLGIWKSTDGGNSFNHLTSTNNANFRLGVQKLIIHPTTEDIYASTRANGVMRSTDGGSTWVQVLGAANGSVAAKAADIEIDDDGNIYVSMGLVFEDSDGIYKSSTGDAGSWTKLNNTINGFPETGFNRLEIAIAPTNPDVIVVLAQSSGEVPVPWNPLGYGIFDIYKSTDGGTTWLAPVNLPVPLDPTMAGDFTRSQAWYDLIAAFDPNDEDVIFVGGIDLFKSIDGGVNWIQLSHWSGLFHPQEVHADQHEIVFEPGSSDVIYFGNDGGVYRTEDGTAAQPTIKSKELGYNTTQFYACAIHPTFNTTHFLGGTQDNGSQKFTQAGINSTPEVTGGDGAFCHIDQNEPQFQFTSYVYNNYFRSIDGGNNFTSVSFNDEGQFINPTDYDDVNNRMYCGNTDGTYLRWNNPQTGSSSAIVTVTAFAGSQVTAIIVSPNTSNRVFFGLENGKIVRVDNAHTGTSIAGVDITGIGMPTPAWVSSITIENGNDNHILITFSNYGVNSVWETTNGGTSWTSIEGNLPDIPIRWIIFSPVNNDQALVATELGVWSTDNLNGSSTDWGPSNTGLANVSTHMLQYRQSDNFLIAATHGRGLFSTDAFSSALANFGTDRRVAYKGKEINFIDNSTQATSWFWNFGDGNNSSLQNPSHSYETDGVYTVSLTINGSITETKNSYITILPQRATPYTLSQGGNFEANPNDFANDNVTGTPWERGNSSVSGKDGIHSPSNAWVTGLANAQYFDNTNSSFYTPEYNFTMNGTYTISFWSKYSTEATWDGFQLQSSTDKGETWELVGDLGPNWYNTTNPLSVFPDEPFFGGVQPAFTQYFTNISSLAGNNSVVFRFLFLTDTNTPDVGIAIDDFEIMGPSNPLPPVTNTFYMTMGADDKMYFNGGSTTNNTSKFGRLNNNFSGIEQIYKNITIPQNAVVTSAILEVKANATGSATVVANIYSDLRDDPSSVMNYSQFNANTNFSSVNYQYTAPAYTAENFYQIEITSLIQDRVNNANWTDGDNLGIIIKGNPNLSSGFREITRAEISLTDNKLIITYQTESSNDPSIDSIYTTSLSEDSVTLNAEVNTGSQSSVVRFQWDINNDANWANDELADNSPLLSDGNATLNVSGLSPNTTYYYRAYASNGSGSDTSEIKSFTTLSISLNDSLVVFPLSSNDDGYLSSSSTATYRTSQYSNMGSISGYRHSLIRFPDAGTVAGKTIDSAFVYFTAYGNSNSSGVNIRIAANDTVNAQPISSNRNIELGKALTSSVVDWNDIPVWSDGAIYRSPDLKMVIQEWADLPNHINTTDALVLFFNNNSSTTNGRRVFSQWDFIPSGGGQGDEKAKLVIYYNSADHSKIAFVSETEILPKEYELYQNYPNPFNPSTNIKFGLPAAGNVRLDIFNILGENVITLLDKEMPAGFHTISFDAGVLPSGIYIYRIQTSKFSQTKKMLMIK